MPLAKTASIGEEWLTGDEGVEGIFIHPVTGEPLQVRHQFQYASLPTLKKFHKCRDEIRAVVGPVGSGKTAAGAVEVCFRIPLMLYNRYGIDRTRWIVLRNTYPMLIDSTQRTFFEWFPPVLYGTYNKNDKEYKIQYTTTDKNGEPCELFIDILFRSCDNPNEVEKFRGYELTGYLIDEADQVHEDIKLILKQRIGRFPKFQIWRKVLKHSHRELKGLSDKELHKVVSENLDLYQTAFGIELTNPPSTESPLYYTFRWATPVPGPKPEKKPLENHTGFWQPPYENIRNLRPGYYDRMREMYGNARDWIERYIEGKPGIILKGKNVYHNFSRNRHEAASKLLWVESTPLYRGWDHTGHHPACVVVQMPRPRQIQVLAEFYSEFENINTFAKRVAAVCETRFPGASWTDYGDPAGWQKISTKDGGWTSHTKMIEEAIGIILIASEQNLDVRINAVDDQLMEIVPPDGEPALLVDPDCVRVINGFIGGYYYPQLRQELDLFSDKPLKNKYADVHDALQYVTVKLRGGAMLKKAKRSRNLGRPRDPLLTC
jgi:hypothetical protein